MTRRLCMFFCLLVSVSAMSAPDLESGKAKATQVCGACHGEDGNGTNPLWPKLAEQHVDYLVKQMEAFKAGKTRYDASMAGMVAPLTSQEMSDIAYFYSQQKRTIGLAHPDTVKRGEQLYRGGDQAKHIAACIACHGPDGRGNAQAGFPSLSGQHATYVVKQLLDYQSGQRKTDLNGIMQDIASKMDKHDMEAVANYISGLH